MVISQVFAGLYRNYLPWNTFLVLTQELGFVDPAIHSEEPISFRRSYKKVTLNKMIYRT